METIPSKAASKWSAGAVVLLIFFLPVAYVASTGPVVLLVERGWIPETALEMVYFPLILLCEKSVFIADLIDIYVDWWI